MKSRTSFFNTTVLRKDITRYAPVWGLYTVGLLTLLLMPVLFESSGERAEVLIDSMSGFGIINMILGGLCALMVFGDLFKTRLCYATHALPLRREGWFLTHYTAGVLFSTVPNLFISLIFLPLLGQYWYLALLWFASNLMQYLFFFGVGAFSAMCAGNRLGAAAVYLIINCTTYLLDWCAQDIYIPMLYGMVYDGTFLGILTPVTQISSMELVDYIAVSFDGLDIVRPFQVIGFMTGEWIYLAVIAVLGLVFALLAVLVYRKRNLENAGDFLSLNAIKPVFLVVFTLAISYLLHSFLPYGGLFVGIFVGMFAGKMLLERTVRVFKGKTFLFWGVFSTLILLSLIITSADLFGVTRYVPDTEDVEAVYFYDSSDRYDYEDQEERPGAISDPGEIEQYRQFHAAMADGRHKHNEERGVTMYMEYELKNGQHVVRRYDVPVYSPEGQFTREKLSTWQAVFKSNDWQQVIDRVTEADLEIRVGDEIGQVTMTDRQQLLGLLEAMRRDCEEGNMAQNWGFHAEEETAVWVNIHDAEYYARLEEMMMDIVVPHNSNGITYHVYSLSLNVYESCHHTIAYLESLDLVPDLYEK